VDTLIGGGSFVTLASPDRKHFTLIIETMVSVGLAAARYVQFSVIIL